MPWTDAFIPDELSDRDRAVARVLVGLAWGLSTATVLGLTARWLVGDLAIASAVGALLCALAFAAVPWILRFFGSMAIAGTALNLALVVLIFNSGWFGGGLDAPVMVIAPLLPLAVTFLFGGRTGLKVTIILALGLVVLFVLTVGDRLPHPDLSESQELGARALFLGLTIALTALFAGLYQRQRSDAEEQLRRSRDLYRRLFDQSKDVVALTTREGVLIDLNPAGVELVGYPSKEDLLDTEVTKLYVDPGQRETLLERLQSEGYVRNYESAIRTRDGDIRTIEGTTSTIRSESGKVEYLLAILQDVTDKRRAEAEREALLTELTLKNQHLEQFSHAVSHDLKSPLQTIRGFTGLMRRDLQTERYDRLAEFIDTLDRSAEKMGLIVDGLLELARIGRGRMSRETVVLSDVARDATELLTERIEAADATVQIAEDLPTVAGDPALLLTVFQNLIDNAVKYGGNGEPPAVDVGWRRDDRGAVIFVSDNGPGIAAEHRRQVFEPFLRLRSRIDGIGIGLASVQRAIEAHGGRVWTESGDDDHGSVFCFTIPEAGDISEIHDIENLKN